MQNALKNEHDKPYTRYTVGSDDLVILDERRYILIKERHEGPVLRTADDEKVIRTLPLTWREIYELHGEGRLTIEKGHFGARSALLRASASRSFEAPPDIVLRAAMATDFLAEEADVHDTGNTVSRSKESIAAFMDRFKAENPELVKAAHEYLLKEGKNRKLFVSARQFCRLLRRYEEGALDAVALMPRNGGGNAIGSSLSGPELRFALRYADDFRTTARPTRKAAWEDMDRDNRAREAPYRIPSYSQFCRLIREAGDFANESGRTTNKLRVQRKHTPSLKGLQPERPLQIVEMDEKLLDVVSVLTKQDLWRRLAGPIRRRLKKKRRLWLSVALDALTRSVVAMKILPGAPNKHSGVATMAMIAQDKDKIAALTGARSGWPQRGTPEWLHTDGGAAYVCVEFEVAAMMFTGRRRIPPSKHPHLRARVERFFRTINQRYAHLFGDAQTFSNILLKDQHDPEKHAHITDEEMYALLVRLIVDCYHNTVHRSLGMTPLQAWEMYCQTSKGGVAPPPTPAQYRDIFGVTLKRTIGNRGIEIAGNFYASPKLTEVSTKWYGRELVVRLADQDISSISVKHPILNQWVEIPAVHDGLKGVSLWEWTETIRFLTKRHGRKVDYSQETVDVAIRAVKEEIALSRKKNNLDFRITTSDDIEKFEKKLRGAFAYSQPQRYDFGEPSSDAASGEFNEVYSVEDELPAEGDGEPTVVVDPFNPAGAATYDTSAFLSDDERPREGGVDGDASRRVDTSALPSPNRRTKPEVKPGRLSKAKGNEVWKQAEEPKAKRTILITSKKPGE
ncbi:Mu transposase C-terminal domain-containing protein [Rhizobium sp. GCM10022189]|uniref:Mu transposase C-terminal domain-containing protein n=1 Tax=Rhizobium sp. GCM10022189 TaxID=3252654 RepID=UPI00362101CC